MYVGTTYKSVDACGLCMSVDCDSGGLRLRIPPVGDPCQFRRDGSLVVERSTGKLLWVGSNPRFGRFFFLILRVNN